MEQADKLDFTDNDNTNKEVMAIFQAESEEIIERIFNNLFSLENTPANKELIGAIYRDLHSLKGAVRMVGFNNIQTILHKMEDIFDAVNNDKFVLEPEMIKLMSRSLEAASRYLQDSVKNDREIIDEDFNAVISNLEYRLGVKSDPQNLIFFEQNDRLQGLKYLSDLIDKTIGHVTIDVFYCTYTGSEHLMTIHPYFLKQYNGRWFLFGLNEKYNNISNLALDRIIRYRRSDIPFKKNDVIDVNSYFNDIVGVTIPKQDKEIESIRIRFSERRFPYVVSKPIHHSQIVVDSNTVEIKVKQTKELDQQIFSYIPDAVVLSPEWYRNYIREKIEDSLKKYLSVQNDCTDGCELCQ